MSGRTSQEPLPNKAQEERAAADTDTKRFADHASFADPETWMHPVGHSGTRRAWALSVGMLAAFLLGGCGLTFGPRALLWIGVAVFVALAVVSVWTRAWTDYAAEKRRPAADDPRDAAS